jgi:hypothetical protein
MTGKLDSGETAFGSLLKSLTMTSRMSLTSGKVITIRLSNCLDCFSRVGSISIRDGWPRSRKEWRKSHQVCHRDTPLKTRSLCWWLDSNSEGTASDDDDGEGLSEESKCAATNLFRLCDVHLKLEEYSSVERWYRLCSVPRNPKYFCSISTAIGLRCFHPMLQSYICFWFLVDFTFTSTRSRWVFVRARASRNHIMCGQFRLTNSGTSSKWPWRTLFLPTMARRTISTCWLKASFEVLFLVWKCLLLSLT